MNLAFTLMGTYKGAYLSEPTEISLPEPEGYYRVAIGSQFTIYTEAGGLYHSQDYEFMERNPFDPRSQYYIRAID